MRQIAVLSLLLAAALAASYWTWTADVKEAPKSGDTKVALYAATEDELQKLHWESKELSVDVERRKDARGAYSWVDATERKEKKEAKAPPKPPAAEGEEIDPAEPAEPTPTAEPAAPIPEPAAEAPKEIETKHTSFRGGDAADTLWKDFAPLHALRELVIPAGADLATFGLAEPSAKVTVTRGGTTQEIEIGGETYGAKDRYIRTNGKVYLLAQDTTRALEFASTRLVERRVQPFVEDKLDRIDATLPDGRSLGLVQTNKDDKEKAFWAKADAPTDKYSAGDAWVTKLLKLSVRLYAEEPAAPLTSRLTWVATSEGESWKVELLSSTSDPIEWFIRSEYDRALVTLTPTQASVAVSELEELLQ